MLDASLLLVVADHGANFALNEVRRPLSENNAASILRIPLFIKLPGQNQAQRIDEPVTTVDIVPTLLAELGYSADELETDGLVLGSAGFPKHRRRFANSYLRRELQELDESRLGLDDVVAENRLQLNLDNPRDALWVIGPFDSLRGQAMKAVCERASSKVRVTFDPIRELTNAGLENILPAYVSGRFSGKDLTLDSETFLITSNGVIVGSGYTWAFNELPRFFALVEPKYVRQADWSPEAWLVKEGSCLGGGHR